jgi:predicted dithiol-disulfide oxidoreductase (DUF899 family)
MCPACITAALLAASTASAGGYAALRRKKKTSRWRASRAHRSPSCRALPYGFLDLTPHGRQEDWEDSPPGFPQKPTHG